MPTSGMNLINQGEILKRIMSLNSQGFQAYQKFMKFFEPIFKRKLSY